MEILSKEELFGLACSGKINKLEKYWNDGGKLNITYTKFGKEHSLIMGAFRNQQYETVNKLIMLGCKLTDEEQYEIDTEYMKMKTIRNLASGILHPANTPAII
jgi:hypothetical protein